MKSQIYIDGGDEHGSFYCLFSGCHMPPVVFKNRVEYKTIKAHLTGKE